MAGQGREKGKLPRGQGRQAKEGYPGRHGRKEIVEGPGGALRQALEGGGEKRCAIGHRAQGLYGLGPEGALPGLVRPRQAQALPSPPGRQPGWPVYQVLIEQIGDAFRQLEALQRLLPALKVMAQRSELRGLGGQGRQKPE